MSFSEGKKWRVFGIIAILIFLAVAAFFAYVGIKSAIDGTAFIDVLKTTLGLAETAAQDATTGETVETLANML